MTPERAKPFADLLHDGRPASSATAVSAGATGATPANAEQSMPLHGQPGGKLLEVCMTINDTWGYKAKDQDWKTTGQLLHALTDTAGKGGNLLLNVGPTAEGEIPAATVERLQAMGRWMKVNGEAIYATDSGPFPRPLPWGRATQKHDADGGTTLYLHVWNWPRTANFCCRRSRKNPSSGRLLATRRRRRVGKAPRTGLSSRSPATAPDPAVSVVALHFAGPVTVTQQSFNVPGPDGRIEIEALDAYRQGDLKSGFQVPGPAPTPP